MAIVAVGLKIAFIAILVPWLINFLTSALGGLFYTIACALFKMIDILQDVFRKLAGLEPVYISNGGLVGTGGEQDNVILSLLTNSRVIEILITMTLFAVALLIIATIVQLIRVEYTTEGAKNSKGSILGLAIKSLGMFLLVPFLCVVGVGISTTLLKAVDSATAAGGATSISGSLFLAGASESSPLRSGERDYVSEGYLDGGDGAYYKIADDGYAKKEKLFGGNVDLFVVFGVTRSGDEQQQKATLANAIDSAFARSAADAVEMKEEYQFGGFKEGEMFNYSNLKAVRYFYNFGDMNFIVLYIGAGFALVCLFKACFGLVMRMYKIVALFIISPGVLALQPLDGGNAYKGWRKNFIGSVLGAYGIVISLNLFFFLISVINTIKLFPERNALEILAYGPVNFWIKAVFTLVGLLMINDLSAQISGYLGADDSLKQGEAMAKNVGGTVSKYGGMAAKGVIMGKSLLASKLPKSDEEKALENEYAAKGKLDKATADYNKFAAEKGVRFKGDGTVDQRSISRMDAKDQAKFKKLEKAKKDASANYDKNQSGLSVEERQKAAARAAKREKNQLIFNEMFTSGIQDSSIVSFANKMTGGFIKDFGGKSMKGIEDKVYDEEIWGMAKNAKPGAVGKALGKAGDIVSGNWASKVDNKLNENRYEHASTLISGSNRATMHYETGKEALEAVDPSVILANNNANLQRQYQELAKVLNANQNDPANAQKQAAPIVKAIEKLTNELKGKITGRDQKEREDALLRVKTGLQYGHIDTAAQHADNATRNNLVTKANFSDAGFNAMEKDYNDLKKAFNDSVENYADKVSQKLLKDAMTKFEANTGVSASAKLDSIIKEYTTKMEEAAKKASEKAAEKAYQESLAKMIAKFSKK